MDQQPRTGLNFKPYEEREFDPFRVVFFLPGASEYHSELFIFNRYRGFIL
jgi:hypothetical protein